MVEVGLPVVEALPALVAEAGRVVGDGESEGVGFGGLAGKLVRRGGIQRNLLGQRRQRGQHPRAVDVDAGVGFLLDPQRDVGAVFQRRGAGRAAALQVQQGVGQHQVVLADVLVVVVDVVLELRAVLSEVVAGGGHGHDVDVHEVGAAAHHAEGGAGPVPHHHAAGVQVFLGARHDEGRSHPVAGGGRDVGHLVADGRVVLHIVHPRQRLHPAPQRRVGGDVLDPLAVQVDLRPVLLHVGDVLRPGSGWHGAAPCVCFREWYHARPKASLSEL